MVDELMARRRALGIAMLEGFVAKAADAWYRWDERPEIERECDCPQCELARAVQRLIDAKEAGK